MAGTYTLKEHTVWGNMRVVIYDVTNFTNSDTLTVAHLNNIYFMQANVGTADKVISMTKSGNVITFVTSADTYDGQLIVIGK